MRVFVFVNFQKTMVFFVPRQAVENEKLSILHMSGLKELIFRRLLNKRGGGALFMIYLDIFHRGDDNNVINELPSPIHTQHS